MKIKRLLALFVGIALIVFFTLPSMLFGDSVNTTTVEQNPADDWVVIDDTRFDGDSFEVQEADPTGLPDDTNEGEIIDVYCLDWDPDATQGNGIHIGDYYDEANPPDNHVEDLVGNDNWLTDNFIEDPQPNPGLNDSLTDEMSEDAIEILSSVATGASEVDDQLAVWSYTDNYNENDNPGAADVEDAVSRIVEANRDLDATNDVNISELNDIDITLEGGGVTLTSGEDITGKEITVTMEDPLVSGMTDEGKTVTLYILGGSINISFSSSSLGTDTTAIMNDVVDGTGDHDGIAPSRYYYYWWGVTYDPNVMNAVIGGWVDIDGDGLLDTNNPYPNYVPDMDIVVENETALNDVDPNNDTYSLTTSDIDNTTVPGGTMLIPMEQSNAGAWEYNDSNQRLSVKAYNEPIDVAYSYSISFEKAFEGTPPDSAGFDIYADDGAGNPTGGSLGHYSIGADGSVYFANLLPGNYVIVETSTPSGYGTVGNIHITIAEDGSISGLLEIVENTREEEERYDVSFNKVFEGLDAGEVIPGGGAQFTIFDSSGTTPLSNPDILGANPVTISHNGDTVTFSDVVPGTYVIKETSTPSGYITMGPITVTIDENGGISGLPRIVKNDPTVTPPRGSITLNKSGLDATATAGFTLYDSNGAAVGGEKTVTGNGSVEWVNLPKDTYKIVETTIPAGYTQMADITGIVVDSTQLSYSFDRVNTKLPPPPKKTTTTTTTTPVIEVLGIQELPFTGMNPAIPISGASTIFAGGLMVVLSTIRKRFGRK